MAPIFKSIEEDRPFPGRMYLDASVFVSAIASTHPNNKLTLRFIKETVFGPPRLYTSRVIFVEVNDGLLKYLLKRRGDLDLIKSPQLVPDEVWDEVQLATTSLEALIRRGQIEMCKMDEATRYRAWKLQRDQKMRSMDAVHASSCLEKGISDLVCFDSDFHGAMDGHVIWTSTELRKQWTKAAAATAKLQAKKAAEAAQASAPPGEAPL